MEKWGNEIIIILKCTSLWDDAIQGDYLHEESTMSADFHLMRGIANSYMGKRAEI